MGKLALTFACGDYDRVAAVKDGREQVEGVDLNFIPMAAEEIFHRMARYRDFDAAEMSLAALYVLLAKGEQPFVAIPVFPSRMFRHSSIYVNAATGIDDPRQLQGKRIGLPEYQATAMVWQRGLLADEYDVQPRDVTWVAGGIDQPGREERIPLQLPPDVRLERLPPGRTLGDMLESGEIDAVFSPRPPASFRNGSPKVRRLFQNFRAVEVDYYRRTGIFPIMHTVVVRREIYERHPWVALSLYKALTRAKTACESMMLDYPALPYTLPWFLSHLEEDRAVLGADFWPYGIEPNRKVLETLVRYLDEQGLIPRRPDIAEPFAPNTLNESRV